MIRVRWVAICLTVSASIGGNAFAQATVFWTGTGGCGPGFSQASNWVGDVTPANDGSQILGYFHSKAGPPNGNKMTLDVSVIAKGLDIEADTGSANISIAPVGIHTLTLGASGIWMNQTSNNAVSVATIAAPVILSASQTWSITNSDLTVTKAISESSSGTGLTISNTGGGPMSVTLSSPKSTFSGGLSLLGGPGTVLVVGADSTGSGASVVKGPLGTGSLTLGDGVSLLTPATKTYTIGNNIVVGAGGGPATATIEGGTGGGVILTGAISDGGGPGAIQAASLGSVDFEGSNTYSGGTVINLTTATIGNDSGLGIGPVSASGSTLKFTSMAPGLSNPSFNFNQSTVDFSHAGANPTLNGLTMFQSTLNFSPGSTISINDAVSMNQSTLNFSPGTDITMDNMVTDSAGSGNVINIANGSTFTINENASAIFHGTITGPISSSVSVTSDGSGIVDLHGANSYRGGTTITTGALVVADNDTALGSGTVTVNGGALGVGSGVTLTNQVNLISGTIGGYGSVSPGSTEAIAFQGPAFVVGGRGTLGSASGVPVPGTLNFGANANITLGPGGTMQFSIMNATGTPGTDFSTINAPGSPVTITATGVSPFTIQLVAVNPATGQFQLNSANFNNATPYSWTLLSAGTISGFAANKFVVDATTDFQNPFGGGSFSLADVSNSLVLNFTPVPEPSTWALMAAGLCALGAAVRSRL